MLECCPDGCCANEGTAEPVGRARRTHENDVEGGLLSRSPSCHLGLSVMPVWSQRVECPLRNGLHPVSGYHATCRLVLPSAALTRSSSSASARPHPRNNLADQLDFVLSALDIVYASVTRATAVGKVGGLSAFSEAARTKLNTPPQVARAITDKSIHRLRANIVPRQPYKYCPIPRCCTCRTFRP